MVTTGHQEYLRRSVSGVAGSVDVPGCGGSAPLAPRRSELARAQTPGRRGIHLEQGLQVREAWLCGRWRHAHGW